MTLHPMINDLISTTAIVLLHSVWQTLVVAICVECGLSLLKKHSAYLRYTLAVCGMWLMLLVPVMTWISSARFVQPVNTQSQGTSLDLWGTDFQVSQTLSKPRDASDPDVDREITLAAQTDWSLMVVGLVSVWVAGVCCLLLRLVWGSLCLFAIRRTSTSLNAEMQILVQQMVQKQGWKRVPRIRLSDRISVAMVVGLLRPCILIPASCTTQFPVEVLEAVILHEVTHMRRLDTWVILLQRVTEVLLFFHPAVWWLSRRIDRERELSCDLEASGLLGSDIQYVQALEHVARTLFQHKSTNALQLSPTFGGQKMELLARIQHVLNRSDVHRNRSPQAFAIVAFPVLLMALGLLTMSPKAFAEAGIPTSVAQFDPSTADAIGLDHDDQKTQSSTKSRRLERENEIALELGLSPRSPNLQILAEMTRLVEFDYDNVSFGDLIKEFNQHYFEGKMQADKVGLADAHVDLDDQVGLGVKGISLQSALKLLCKEQLGTIVDDGKITLTSAERANSTLVKRHYDLSGPLQNDRMWSATGVDSTEDRSRILMDFLLETTGLTSWEAYGGRGTMTFHPANGTLEVVNTQRIQQSISRVLMLFKVTGQDDWKKEQAHELYRRMPLLKESTNPLTKTLLVQALDLELTGTAAIRNRLELPINFDVQETPLSQILQRIADERSVNVVVDEGGLAQAGITSSTPVTFRSDRLSTWDVVQAITESLGIVAFIENDVLMITSADRDQGHLLIVVYNVDDVIAQAPDPKVRLEELKQELKCKVAPTRWTLQGGSGIVKVHGESQALIVRQHRDVHEQIQKFFKELRKQDLKESLQPTLEQPILKTVAYQVADFLEGQTADQQLKEMNELIEDVEKFSPKTWQPQGGKGTISTHPATKSLIVRQTSEVHKVITDYLKLRRTAK